MNQSLECDPGPRAGAEVLGFVQMISSVGREIRGSHGVLGRIVLVSLALACSRAPASTDPVKSFTLSVLAALGADTALGRPAVIATLKVTNTADSTQRIAWAECPSNGPLTIRVHSRPGGPVVWNSVDAYSKVNCIADLHYVNLAPAETWTYQRLVPVADILGDSLPNGTYEFSTSSPWLEPGFPDEISAGDLVLSR